MEHIRIKDLSDDDKPREKLEQHGPSQLTDAELLAILVGSGNAKESAVSLMQHVLKDCNNNLNTLGKKSIQELEFYNGIGPAKAITILAACELGKRRQMANAEERFDLSNATSIYNYMHPRMQDLYTEEFWILLMNQNYKLIKAMSISHGGITETAVDIRIILKEVLLSNATILAVCHNHPSNNTTPSRQDDQLTERIKNACQIMRIFFVDHLIITDGKYYSYQEQGKL